MRLKINAKLLALAIFFILSSLLFTGIKVFAEEGDDNSDYIEIKTVQDLYSIRSNMDANYKLMNDIDLTEATAPGGDYDYNGCGWNPIGSNNSYSNLSFTGVFDGQGYSIKGLKFNISGCSSNNNFYIGLFANNNGTIKNIKFTNCEIKFSGSNPNVYLGTVAATNSGEINNIIINDLIFDVYLTPGYGAKLTDAINAADAYVGGIAGENKAKIISSSVEADFDCTAEGSSSYINYVKLYYSTIKLSGIACNNTGSSIISQCSSRGTFKETLKKTGTQNGNPAVIDSAGISWTSEQYSGGNVNKSYSEISTSDYGIANKGSISESYYTGVGKSQESGTASNCYYITGKGSSGTGWVGLNENQMKESDSFEGFDFDNTWRYSDETAYKYPQLQAIQNGITKVEIVSEPTNEIVVGTELKYEGAVARIYREDGTTSDVELTPENTSGGDTSTSGKKTVTFTYRGVSASFEIEVVPVKVNALEIVSLPTKVDYVEGQIFDPSGLSVDMIYNNGTRITCNDYSLSDVDTTVGEKTVTISYNSVKTTFTVNYIAKSITKLEVTTPPTKTIYDEDESFDKTGMVVKATYNDGEIKEVTDYTISDNWGYGSINIVISYDGKTATTPITVRKIVKSISFDKAATEIWQKDTDSLNVTFTPSDAYNKELIWTSSNESVATVDENGNITGIRTGTTEIKATKKGHDDIYAVCNVTVKAIYITDIEITKQPNKTRYIEGESFDPTGMVVSYVYSNNSKEVCDDYTVGDITGTGDVNVKISYEEFEKLVPITVATVSDIEISSQPSKTRYKEGESFDSTGLVVKKVYSDGVKEKCNDYAIGKISGVGNIYVKISWGNFEKSVPITVVTLSDIEIVSQPYKTNYIEGESFDSTGLSVKAVYSDGAKEKCNDYTIGTISGTGNVQVPITYAGFVKYINIFIDKKSSEVITSGESFENAISAQFGQDYYREFLKGGLSSDELYYYKININEQGVLNIYSKKPQKSVMNYIDMYFYIYDSSYNCVWSYKTYQSTKDLYGYYNLYIGLKPGTYYVGIGTYQTSGLYYKVESTIKFDFKANQNCEIEPNNTKEQSTIMKLGNLYEGYYGNDAASIQYDYWSVYLEKGKKYKFSFIAYNSYFNNSHYIVNMTSPNGSNYLMSTYLQKSGKDNCVSFTSEETGYYYIWFTLGNDKQLDYTIMMESLEKNNTNTNTNNGGSSNNTGNTDSNKNHYSNEWVNGKWYNADGTCTYSGTLTWKNNSTGWWVEDTAGWYPQSQWQKIDGIWYYFKPDGYMASAEYYDGYWFNSDGSWDEQYFLTWKSNSTGWWVEDKSGWWPSSQWLKIDGSWYYFDASGYMVTSQYVDGYWLGADGACW